MYFECLESRQLLATVGGAVTLTGTAYYDSNANAKFDANEMGLNEFTIYLDVNDDNKLYPGDP